MGRVIAMKSTKNLLVVLLSLGLCAMPALCTATGENPQGDTRTAEQIIAEMQAKRAARITQAAAAQKNENAKVDNGQMTAAAASKKQKRQKARYVQLLNDNGFNYAMDTQNAKWIKMPHSGDEYIVDVWVRLDSDGTQKEDAKKDADYHYPQTYYLEHYYIRPDHQQIQFLCELEVTGRPDNAIHERAYSMGNWEDLVPGSIEDDIYHGVLKNMPKNALTGKKHGGKSLRDEIEDKLWISM